MDKKLAEEKVREMLASLTPEQLAELQNSFAETMDTIKNESVEKLETLKVELERLKSEKKSLGSEYTNWDEKQKLNESINSISISILNQENVVKVLENNGLISNVTDQNGYEYKDVPDFRKVDSTDFNFDEKNVLIIPTPKYIPFIDEDRFKQHGYVFDAIRVTEDSYMVCVGGYSRSQKETNSFFIATLDQLVLIIDYYYSKAKAKNIEEAKNKNERARQGYFSLSEERKRYYMFHKNVYYALSAVNKKKVSKDEWDEMDLEEREKYYLPIKTYGTKRLDSVLVEGKMWASFHYMYEDLIDKTKIPTDKEGKPTQQGRHANPVVGRYWRDFAKMINYKLKDIKIQREDYSENYKQAIETSFGESNVDTILKEKYGILVKRQNGDKINAIEIDLIEKSWIKIQNVYGNLKAEALKNNLKISHSGERLIFAMKALGVYISQMGTIGVSNKLGEVDFTSTFSHEVAHFIDNFIGKLNGKRWATDDYESLAGKIAFTFRQSMNKNENEQTDYINATKECFARAFQQYFGMKTEGEDAVTKNVDNKIAPEGIEIWKHPNFVNKFTFKDEVEPLIEQFLKENLDVFETTVDIDGTNDLAPITEEEEIEIGLEFYEYFEPVKRRVVKVTDKLVFSVPVTEGDDYQFKSVFKLEQFKEILSRQNEFEAEINESETNRVKAESKKSEQIQKEADFKKAVSSFVEGDLEVGKAIKSLDQVHNINRNSNTLKNHIEKFVSEIKDPKEVTVRDINGKPHFSENGSSYTPLINRSGEKYFEYLLNLKKPTEEPEESIQDLIDGLEILVDISEGEEKKDLEDTIEGLKLLLDIPILENKKTNEVEQKKVESLISKLQQANDRFEKANKLENDKLAQRGWGYGMRHSKIGFSTSKSDKAKERIKEIEKELKDFGYDRFGRKI